MKYVYSKLYTVIKEKESSCHKIYSIHTVTDSDCETEMSKFNAVNITIKKMTQL